MTHRHTWKNPKTSDRINPEKTRISSMKLVKFRTSGVKVDWLATISQWMSAHHQKLNFNNTELLFPPQKVSDLSITTESSVVSLNLSVTPDNQLSFVSNITVTTPSCRLILHIRRRIRSAQVLSDLWLKMSQTLVYKKCAVWSTQPRLEMFGTLVKCAVWSPSTQLETSQTRVKKYLEMS